MLGLNLNKNRTSSFQPLQVVGRGDETQLQVVVDLDNGPAIYPFQRGDRL